MKLKVPFVSVIEVCFIMYISVDSGSAHVGRALLLISVWFMVPCFLCMEAPFPCSVPRVWRPLCQALYPVCAVLVVVALNHCLSDRSFLVFFDTNTNVIMPLSP